MTDTTHIVPRHVGIILDGNRRWAKKHGLPTYEGHLAGYNVVKEVGLEMLAQGVKYLTLYGFSSENWQRDEQEVSNIMGLVLRAFSNDLPTFDEHNVRLRVLGGTDRLSPKIVKAIHEAEERTKNNTGGTLSVCFNYGGQQEIADAVKAIIAKGTAADEVTPELIEQHLYAPDVPPIDIIARTSGEQRLSNFMLWRAAYSELLFLDKMWPEMTKDDVTIILKAYTERQRRFGA